ncbi:MAG TPA: AAA family ATPase [Oligoflexia bacterium]|nr:AAA family ATPase [Oligoflexia bacterium]HMP26764.1 AAA family ATPase [Oligoflexia bacterium]
MYQRLLNLSKSQSFFLFGARGTGKSVLTQERFKEHEAIFLDLLNPELTNSLSAYPNRLLDIIEGGGLNKQWVVIDEIQKVPALLDIIHQQLSKKRLKFALTGSSARKLKRGASNLLAGRAFVFNLFPLTHKELGKDFNLISALKYGSLPEVYHLETTSDKIRYLKAYANTYLTEEIIAEQILRNLPPFRRFLEVMALHITEIVNYSNIAKDVDTDPKTVLRYYEILEDTLLGFHLPTYSRSVRKQQRKARKFYFFDCGVARVLSNRADESLPEKSFEYGRLFENFIVNEIYRLLSYKEKQFKLSFLRIEENYEIDLIVEKGSSEIYLCEIKSSEKVDERHVNSLELLRKDFNNPKLFLISNDPIAKKIKNTRALHWTEALNEICR